MINGQKAGSMNPLAPAYSNSAHETGSIDDKLTMAVKLDTRFSGPHTLQEGYPGDGGIGWSPALGPGKVAVGVGAGVGAGVGTSVGTGIGTGVGTGVGLGWVGIGKDNGGLGRGVRGVKKEGCDSVGAGP